MHKKSLNILSGLVAAGVLIGSGGVPVVQADIVHGHLISGEIERTYLDLGGHDFFGDALAAPVKTKAGGIYQRFAKGSSIYSHPDVEEGRGFQVGGAIRSRWVELGRENGMLGHPVSNELPFGPNKEMRFNNFQNGSMYWSERTGAEPILGRIEEYWIESGMDRSHLGMPIDVQKPDAMSIGLNQQFEKGKVHLSPASPFELPVSDRKPHSSYRLSYPLFSLDKSKNGVVEHLTPAGLNQHVIRDFDTHFPLDGCHSRLRMESQCKLTTIGGAKETLHVSTVSDDGFALSNAEGSPEGSNRVTTFRFRLISPSSHRNDPDVVFANAIVQGQFASSEDDEPWVALEVESFGDIADAQWSGPFNNRRIAKATWGRFAQSIAGKRSRMETVYLTEGIPGLADLVDRLGIFNQRAMVSGSTVKQRPEVLSEKDYEEIGAPGVVYLEPMTAEHATEEE